MKDIYLLPGTMCDQRMWSLLERELAKVDNNDIQLHYLTIGRQLTIDELLNDILAQLPHKPINLLGFSLGGYLACALSLKFPKRINSLFVVSNMPCALPEHEVKERTRTIHWLKTHGYNGIPTKRVLNLLDKSAWQNEETVELIKVMDKSFGGAVLQQQLLATTQRKNLFQLLPQLNKNKYFCVGENDTLASSEALISLVEQDPLMSLKILPNTGHMLPLEQPKKLTDWLMAILK